MNNLLVGYKDRDGTASVTVQEDLTGGTTYSPMSITKAQVIAGTSVLDSSIDTDAIQVSGNVITFEKGAFAVPAALYPLLVVVFNDDNPDGKVVIGPGLKHAITLDLKPGGQAT